MSFVDSARPYRGLFGRRIADLKRRYAAARHRRAIFLRTYSELQALSDRDLADLGFARSEIGSLARDAARKA